MNSVLKFDSAKVSKGLIACRNVAFALFLLNLAGCVSTPNQLRHSDDRSGYNATPLNAVQSDAAANLDKEVRWGGTVVSVENLKGESRIEIIARPLYRYGRPDVDRVSEGRFIASFDEFLDPADYAQGREITVVGTIGGVEYGKVGQADYKYPLVQASAHQLWDAVSSSRFAQRRAFHNAGYSRGYSRYRDPFWYGFGARYHSDYVFADWWLPALFWSFHGHYGHHHRSRLHLDFHYRR